MAMPTSFPASHNPATDLDRTGPNRLTCPDTVGIYLIQACGFTPTEPSTPGLGLGRLVPPAPSRFDTIPPLPCTANDFGDSRRHGPRVNNSDSARTSEPLVAPIVTQDTAAGTPRSLPPATVLLKTCLLYTSPSPRD